MSLKNKFIFILMFCFILLLFSNSSVFATFDFTYNGELYSFPDLPFDTTEHPDFVIMNNFKDGYYQVGYPNVAYQTPFYYSTISSSQQGIQYWKADDTVRDPIGHSSGGAGVQWCYSNLYFDNLTAWGSINTTGANQLKTKNNSDTANVIFATCDIINTDGTIFFQRPPILNQIVKTAEIKVTLKEVIVILPLIIVTLVSFLGLRKALTMLSAVLHHS